MEYVQKKIFPKVCDVDLVFVALSLMHDFLERGSLAGCQQGALVIRH